MKQNAHFRPAHWIILAVSALIFTSLLLIPMAIRPAEAATQLTDATIQAYEAELKRLQQERSELYANIVSAKSEQTDALELKGFLDRQLSLTLEEIDTLEALIEETDVKIGTKQLEIIDKKADVAEQRQNFLDRLRITYEEGDVGYLELLLGAESLYDFLTRVERIGCMMEYNIRIMEQYQNDTVELEAAEDELEALQLLNEDKKVELEAKQEDLENQQDQNNADLAALQQSISASQSSYAAISAKEAEVDKEMQAYIKELQAKANAAYVGGEFIWPVDISWKRISSNYGYRTLNGVREFHRGIDIPANAWSNIYASNSGTVITAAYHWSYGNYVIIDHGGGKSTLYAHANQLNVKVGDKVKQGQVIAKVGTTGHSYGNHVHFEVRLDGVCQNPIEYVTQPQ
ncbi:MAG: peptidoglycan DD-metalloendopeptidase family protein [Clostridia bacterium]|nr:peptidoglycan DD-metalloendopeptidase family protein [Clostridia bacterium]